MAKEYSTLISEIQDIRAEIRELKAEITRYKGFLGGVMWTCAALSACVHLFLQWLRGVSHA